MVRKRKFLIVWSRIAIDEFIDPSQKQDNAIFDDEGENGFDYFTEGEGYFFFFSQHALVLVGDFIENNFCIVVIGD